MTSHSNAIRSLAFLAAGLGALLASPSPAKAQEPSRSEEFGGELQAPLNREVDRQRSAPLPEDRDRAALRDRRWRLHNTWSGPTGGIHVIDAGSAPAGSVRIQLGVDFFSASDYLQQPVAERGVQGDTNDYFGAALSLDWTATDFLEVFAVLESRANANDQEEPELFQVLGEMALGAKGFYEVIPWLTVGGHLFLHFLNDEGDVGIALEGTSVGLGANATADWWRIDSDIPLITRLGFDYYFDNSAQIVEDKERERFAALEDARENPDFEYRHLLSAIERFALNVNRTDMLTLSLGLEAPLTASTDVHIHPLLEWRLGFPVSRQGYSCLEASESGVNEDSCLEDEGISAFPQTLTLGARVFPWLKGAALLLGVDIGITGTSSFVRELAPTRPYAVLLAFSYAFDTKKPEPEVRTIHIVREVPVERQVAPPKGRILGSVVERGTDAPVPHAIISYPGSEWTAQQASEEGRFVSYALDPGEWQLEISHPEYESGVCAATIPQPEPQRDEEQDIQLRCELVAHARMGAISGHVSGTDGAAVENATITLSGPITRELTSDKSGAFSLPEAPPGPYVVRVDAEGHFIKVQQLEVVGKETTEVHVRLIERPDRPLVLVGRGEITIRRQINFATDSANIDPRSEALLSEIADVFLRKPEIELVEIQGHTDDRGSAQYNLELSQRRAYAVRDWLVRAGVAVSRLESKGYGPTRPILPNITRANRARNRRVQFIIKKQTLEEGEGQ